MTFKFDPHSRGDAQILFNARAADQTRQRNTAQRNADANGLRNQRLAELELALRGLNPDAWPGLDAAQAALRVLPVLEAMVG